MRGSFLAPPSPSPPRRKRKGSGSGRILFGCIDTHENCTKILRLYILNNSSLSCTYLLLAPPQINSVHVTPNLLIGESLFIECTIDGIPPPTTTWMKDGAPLEEMQVLMTFREVKVEHAV